MASKVLLTSEHALVTSSLTGAIAAGREPRQLCTQVFSGNATTLLLAMPTNYTRPEDYSVFIVQYCLLKAWTTPPPSMMEQLLGFLVHTIGIGGLNAALVRVPTGVDPNPSPYDVQWMYDDLPFFDRHELRQHARPLIEGNTRPLLRVTGSDDAVGHSYTRRYFEHIREHRSGYLHVVTVEVSQKNGPSYDVVELAESLTAQMGVNEPAPTRSTASYSRSLCRWVLRNAMSRPGLWLFLLDGFGQQGINPEVRELVEQLAVEISGGEYRNRMRLVLADFAGNLPQAIPRVYVLEENLRGAAHVTNADLEACIGIYNDRIRMAGKPGIDPSAIARIAAGIAGRAPASGKARLQFFNEELCGLGMFGA